MNAEQWLLRGHRIEDEIEWLEEEITALSARVYSATPNYDTNKVQTSHINSSENIKIKYVELREKYEQSLRNLEKIKSEIEDVISKVPRSVHRIILRSRVLKGNRWHIVADDIHYSVKQTKRLYKCALDEVEKILSAKKSRA